MNKKAVTYYRLSQESDTSIEDQRKECQNLAEKHDFKIIEEFNEGQRSSGFDNERPKYLEMQAVLEEKDIDAVIVRDRDRISRDKRERSMLMYDLQDWDVELWTTSDGRKVDFGDDESWLIEMIRAYMDDVQKRREIQKAKRKVDERVDNGYYQGNPPFGLKFDDKKQYLVPDEDFDKAIKVIELREQGKSYNEIEKKIDGMTTSKAWRIVNKNKQKYLELST